MRKIKLPAHFPQKPPFFDILLDIYR
ncbi:acetyl-CoA carboxylase, partial [Neisseria gonorrhoeae]